MLTAFKNINDRISQFDLDDEYETVEGETLTVEERISFIERELEISDQLLFEDLFPHNSSKIDLIVTFLAVLELIRIGTIVTVQTGLFESIYLVKAKTEESSITTDS